MVRKHCSRWDHRAWRNRRSRLEHPLPKKHTAAEYRKVMSTKLSFSCYSTFQCSPIHVPWPGRECWGMFQERYLHPEENPSLERVFFLFCFCTKQVPCRNFPQLPSLPIDPRPQMTPPFFRHFSKGVVTLLNPFLHSGPLHPLPGPHQSQGIVSPLSPIDRFFFPPMENFLCIKWQRKCLVQEEQPDLAVLQDRRWLFSI